MLARRHNLRLSLQPHLDSRRPHTYSQRKQDVAGSRRYGMSRCAVGRTMRMQGLSRLSRTVCPEMAAGGFSRRDNTLAFYLRVTSLIEPTSVVLDLGAGRGAQFDKDDFRARFIRFRGRVGRLVGVDVDPVVLTNPALDEAHIIAPDKPLPFPDGAFDIIYSDWVLEHIEKPAFFAAEVERVLKPGGWFCARTPNRWGYIALSARLVPEGLQSRILRFTQPTRKDEDVFPKFYRLNTMEAVRRHFPESRFDNASYTLECDPSYHGGRLWLYRLIDLYQSLPSRVFDTVLFVFLKKKGDA